MSRRGRTGRRGRTKAAVAAVEGRKVPALPEVSGSLGRLLRPQAAFRWLLPQVAAITPQYIETVLRGALAGNHVQQWEIFDLMLDTWPELSACAQEMVDGVRERKLIFEAWSEEDEDATEEAQERCKLVSAALRRMRPAAYADENDLEGTLKDILDGWFRGVCALEVDWQMVRSPSQGRIVAPRATWWVHPVCFAFDREGRLGLRAGAVEGSLGGAGDSVAAFPEHKFLVGIHKARSGTALGGAMLRPLAWWWCAANFSADWLLNLAQVFGLPFRWANYDAHAPQATVDAICTMLQNMGSAGWAAFPAGTTLELKEATKEGGDHSPQGELLDRADRYARLVLLGQTMSGGQDASKGGGKAFGSVESEVKARRVNAAAKYACGVLNGQLIPSILMLNYGDAEEAPVARLLEETEGDLEAAQRDRALAEAGLEIPKSFLRKKYALPAPSEGEEVIGGRDERDEGGNLKLEWGEEEHGRDAHAPWTEEAEGTDGTDFEGDDDEEVASREIRRLLAIGDDGVFARELGDLAAVVADGNSEGAYKGWNKRGRGRKRENAERGMKALEKVLATKADVTNAMAVEGVGPVDFRWAVGSRGFQQIVGNHRIAARIPVILAYGEVVERGATRVAVEYRGHRVILSNNVEGAPTNHWVLTGYRNKKGNR